MKKPRAWHDAFRSSLVLALSVGGALASTGGGCDRREAEGPAPSVEADALPHAEAATAAQLALGDIEGEVWRADATGAKGLAIPGRLRQGDVITAGANGRAIVRLFDGRELLIAPGTRLRVGASNNDDTLVELEGGTIVSRSSMTKDGSSDVTLSVLTPFGITRIPAGPGKVGVSMGRDTVSVAVDLGGVIFIDRTGRQVTAGAGDRIEVTVGGAQILPASNPTAAPTSAPMGAEGSVKLLPDRPVSDLVLPTARNLRIYADRLSEVTLSWPPGFSPSRVEVARDAAGKDIVVSGRPRSSRVTVNPPREGDLYWSVVARDGTRVLRGHARFRPDRGRSVLDLDHPKNLVTERSEGTKVYFQGARPALTFAFAPPGTARRYRLRVFRAGALAEPLYEKEVNQPRCAVPPGLLDEGSYLWHAQGIDDDGRVTGGGRLNKLELVYENALNSLAIGRPRSGDLVVGEGIPVSGVAPLGDTLFVNGQPAPTDDKGRFDLRVARASTLIFRLVGRDGSESYWVRRLRVGS